MTYIIMADGKERRWGGYQGIHKWQISIDGQTILERTCALLKKLEPGAEVIVTSHNPAASVPGTTRHEPENNLLEIDRFTWELIGDNVCFLYGDSYYSENDLKTILTTEARGVLCFGSEKKIFAVKVAHGALFRAHITSIREKFLRGELSECIGWQVYHSVSGLPLEGRAIGENYVMLSENTCDFNCPEDLMAYREKKGGSL